MKTCSVYGHNGSGEGEIPPRAGMLMLLVVLYSDRAQKREREDSTPPPYLICIDWKVAHNGTFDCRLHNSVAHSKGMSTSKGCRRRDRSINSISIHQARRRRSKVVVIAGRRMRHPAMTTNTTTCSAWLHRAAKQLSASERQGAFGPGTAKTPPLGQ